MRSVAKSVGGPKALRVEGRVGEVVLPIDVSLQKRSAKIDPHLNPE